MRNNTIIQKDQYTFHIDLYPCKYFETILRVQFMNNQQIFIQ